MATYTGITVGGGKIIDGETMTANLTSDVVEIQDCTTIGLQFVSASATHVGTLAIQISNDKTNWHALPIKNKTTGAVSATIAVSSGAAVADWVDVVDCGAKYLRVVYTFTSGTGTLTVTAHKKKASGR